MHKNVLDICNGLNLREVVFVGHSVSSMIGLLAAIEKPQYFKKLIMVGLPPVTLMMKIILVVLKKQI
jgi:sigma-B regulation protein RsbQ